MFVVFAAEGVLVCRSGLWKRGEGETGECARVRACKRGGSRLLYRRFAVTVFLFGCFPSSTVPVVLRAGVASEDGSNSVASSSFQS